jgi:hypothetical protein
MKPEKGVNDLATTHPNLAAQAHGWDPSTVSAGSCKKLEWQCEKGHVWVASPNNRSYGRDCERCAGQGGMKLVVGETDLATIHPDLAAQAHGWDPTTVTAGSGKRREWICKEGHVWTTKVVNRARVGTGCRTCYFNRQHFGRGPLAIECPEIAAQAEGWDPMKVTSGSNKQLKWRCEKGHVWIAIVSNRVTHKTGCPICANRQIVAGDNDIATTHPELGAQAYGWDPTTIVAGSNDEVQWRCEKGHVWTTSPRVRITGVGCAVCANRQIVAGDNDIATTHPELGAQAYGWDPTTVTYGTDRVLAWRCENGHIWFSSPNARTNKSESNPRRCPECR